LDVQSLKGRDFRLDWQQLGPWLARQAGAQFLAIEKRGQVRYDGLHVYLSYNPKNPSDGKLRNWANNVLDRFAGVEVVSKERKTKFPPSCPSCHQAIAICPHCQAEMTGTVEKGIDTAIVTDMIRLAWEDSYDLAVLVSSDRDFIPAVELLNAKGRKVIHAGFPPRGMDLARKCWASIDLRNALGEVERVPVGNGPASARW
jgi:uncharacterized LabA/DUF88 family protein